MRSIPGGGERGGPSTADSRTFRGCLVDIGKASKPRNARTMRANQEKNEVSMQAGEAEARFVDTVAGRRRAEDALRESEERYRRLVELSPAAIAVHREGVVGQRLVEVVASRYQRKDKRSETTRMRAASRSVGPQRT